MQVKFLLNNKIEPKAIAVRLGLTVQKVYHIVNQISRENYENDSANVLYHSKEWKLLRELVLQRDGYRCVKCGAENSWKNSLQIDHVLSKAYHPELAFDASNLRTLCARCHRKTKTFKAGSKNVGRKI